jgi:hypothetical protein
VPQPSYWWRGEMGNALESCCDLAVRLTEGLSAFYGEAANGRKLRAACFHLDPLVAAQLVEGTARGLPAASGHSSGSPLVAERTQVERGDVCRAPR